ncbi:MAG: hypothetical protein AB1758_15670 [Candidatus Eremiobacterota bacterium]
MTVTSASSYRPASTPRTLVEPPPPGFNPDSVSFKEVGRALAYAAGPITGLVLGGYAGLATGTGAAVAGALALGSALGAAGFAAGLYGDILNGIGGKETNLHAWGLGLGAVAGGVGGALLGASVANPWVAGAMAVAGALGATYWTLYGLGR